AVNVADFFRQVLVEAKVERDRADLLHIVKRRPETKEGQQYDQYRRTCHAVYSPEKIIALRLLINILNILIKSCLARHAACLTLRNLTTSQGRACASSSAARALSRSTSALSRSISVLDRPAGWPVTGSALLYFSC